MLRWLIKRTFKRKKRSKTRISEETIESAMEGWFKEEQYSIIFDEWCKLRYKDGSSITIGIFLVVIPALAILEKYSHMYQCCEQLAKRESSNSIESATNKTNAAELLDFPRSTWQNLIVALSYVNKGIQDLSLTNESLRGCKYLCTAVHAFQTKGNILRRLQMFDEAQKSYDKADQIFNTFRKSSNSEVHIKYNLILNTAILHLITGDAANAFGELVIAQRSFKSCPGNDNSLNRCYYFLGVSYMAVKKFDKAIEEFKCVPMDYRDYTFGKLDVERLIMACTKGQYDQDMFQELRRLCCLPPSQPVSKRKHFSKMPIPLRQTKLKPYIKYNSSECVNGLGQHNGGGEKVPSFAKSYQATSKKVSVDNTVYKDSFSCQDQFKAMLCQSKPSSRSSKNRNINAIFKPKNPSNLWDSQAASRVSYLPPTRDNHDASHTFSSLESCDIRYRKQSIETGSNPLTTSEGRSFEPSQYQCTEDQNETVPKTYDLCNSNTHRNRCNVSCAQLSTSVEPVHDIVYGDSNLSAASSFRPSSYHSSTPCLAISSSTFCKRNRKHNPPLRQAPSIITENKDSVNDVMRVQNQRFANIPCGGILPAQMENESFPTSTW